MAAMSNPNEGAASRRGDDATEIEDILGSKLIVRLYGLLRALRIYETSNQTVQDQLREFLGLAQQAIEDELILVAMGQCFYVNGVRVRAGAAQAALFDALTQEFERRKLGGLRLLDGVRADELATFLRLFIEHSDPERAALLGDALAANGITRVIPVGLGELPSGSETENARTASETPGESERALARQNYAQAVHGVRRAILHTARTGKPAMRRIKRVVQPIVDSIMKNEQSIIGLTAIKTHDEYTYAHCVNVSILAVAIGHYLGLSRAQLASLGVAALLHDIGKLTIPPDVLRKPGKMTEQEWELMERHPIEGMKVVARAPGLTALTLDLIEVALQHHLTCDGRGYPKASKPAPISALSRIVTVADCFDAMTAHRAYRKRPFTGHEALRLLLGPDRGRYDTAALWALVKTVGLYPAGTILMTSSRHIVISLSPNPEDPRRPNCRVLSRPDGSMPPDTDPELWSPMPNDVIVSSVVDPDEFEGEIDRLLAA
jgi:HD-GYP domain-containing protein (c-di-GMP phosphodiesterase class II)